MFDHIEFSVSHLGKARQFYRPICEAIGCEEAFFDEAAGELGFETRGVVQFLITQGEPTLRNFHLCFKASDIASVEKAYAGAIVGGGVCNGAPGYRDHYAQGYFAAFVFDPDGHNVEILFRDPSC